MNRSHRDPPSGLSPLVAAAAVALAAATFLPSLAGSTDVERAGTSSSAGPVDLSPAPGGACAAAPRGR